MSTKGDAGQQHDAAADGNQVTHWKMFPIDSRNKLIWYFNINQLSSVYEVMSLMQLLLSRIFALFLDLSYLQDIIFLF